MSFLSIDHMTPHASRISKIRGAHVAIVVDNKDGEFNPGFRVKLKLPWLHEQEATFWARIAIPMAGADRGTYVLPEIDDQVLVVFEHGDIGRPIVIGALWSVRQAPVEVNQSGLNNTKLIKSRSGHRIIFDDQDGAEKLTIVDRTGKNKIVLDAANRLVRIESDGDIDVVATANVILHGRALRIGTSDAVTGKAKSLLGHAQKTFSLKATDAITIGGGATTINTSSAPATRVSGAGTGELGGGSEPGRVGTPGAGNDVSGAGKRGGAATAIRGKAGDSAGADPPNLPSEGVPLATLEVVVLDDGQRPISGVRFRVKDPNGNVHEGTTNLQGEIRIEHLPSGHCEVSFP